MLVAVVVSLCLLHDVLGVVLFLASHTLHTVYLIFFARRCERPISCTVRREEGEN
jgi:hypothetical protein